MSNPKLILIEGIPGSGKTTTARFVCAWLEQNGKHPALFLEGDWNHPADYESVACLNESEYAELQAQFPEFVGFLAHHAKRENDQWLFSYRKLEHEQYQAPSALFKTLSKFEIYDLPPKKHKQIMRQSWKNFVTRAIRDDFTYVFECCFLQNPITTLLARHNQPIAAIHQHLLDLAEMIRTLEPRLIYLAPPDPRSTLENVRQERPQDWADYVTWYLTEQEFGKAHGLKGFKGVIDFYTIRQALELEFLSTLPMPSIEMTNAPDWSGSQKYLEAFLKA